MGYRVRLGRISKKDADKIRHLSYEKLEQNKIDFHRPKWHTELYEIGKYVSFEKGRIPFYTKFNIYKMCGSEFDILTKEGLKFIISSYRKAIFKQFHKLYKIALKENLSKKDKQSFINYFRQKVEEWNYKYNLYPYYLDEKCLDGFVVKSWEYEYAIFNLTYIYRSFDWENDYLIYSGW